MPVRADDLQLTAPAPDPVIGTSAQIVGPIGSSLYHYWWVAHYPIGVSVVSAPVLVRNAPDITSLSATNYVTVSGQAALGATSYDLLRTNGPRLPTTGPTNIAVATGLTAPVFQDQGAALTAYNIAGLAGGAPVTAHITVNNRDFASPTMVVSPYNLSLAGALVFPDGSTQNTAFTSAQVYNWTQDVQANVHKLLGLNLLQWISSDSTFTYQASVPAAGASFAPGGWFLQQDSANYVWVINAAGDVWVGPQTTPTGNRLNSHFLITIPPGYATPTNQMLYVYNPVAACNMTIETGLSASNAVLQLLTPTRNWLVRCAGSNFNIVDGANVRITCATNGFTGISSGTVVNFVPAHTLDLNTDDAGKTTTTTWTITSDIRAKRNVKPLEGGIAIIERLQVIEAEYNGLACTPDGQKVVSFDPDELVKVLPRSVSRVRRKLHPEDLEESDIGCVNPHEIIHHLVLAVQQLSRQINSGRSRKRGKEETSNGNRPAVKP